MREIDNLISPDGTEVKTERFPYISIVGSMGAGKSTLAKVLCFGLDVPGFKVERLEENFSKNPYLEPFYENPKKYSYPCQRFFMEAKAKQLKRIGEKLKESCELVDPGREMDFLFALAHLKMGWMTNDQFGKYRERYYRLGREYHLIKPDFYLVINADAPVIRKRVAQRGRPFEQRMLQENPEYFDVLNRLVEEFYECHCGSAVVKIDSGLTDFVNTPAGKADAIQQVVTWMRYHAGKIKNSRPRYIKGLNLPNYILSSQK